MKTATRTAMAGLALAAAGCVQVEQSLTINRNGSGTYELRYALAEQTVQQMTAMFELKNQLGISAVPGVALPADDERVRLFFNPDEAGFKKLVAQYAKHGVTLDRVTVESRRGIRETRLKVALARLSSLASSDLFPDYGFSIRRTPDGDYEFYRKPPDFGEPPPFDMSDPDMMKQLAPFFANFRVTTRLQTPGEVFETNGSTQTRYSAVWTYDFEKDPNAVLKLQRDPMRLVFDGRGSEIAEMRQGL